MVILQKSPAGLLAASPTVNGNAATRLGRTFITTYWRQRADEGGQQIASENERLMNQIKMSERVLESLTQGPAAHVGIT